MRIDYRAMLRPHFNRSRGDGYAVDHYTRGGKWSGTAFFATQEEARRDIARVRRLLRKRGGKR